MVTLRTNRRTEGFTFSLKEIGYQGVRQGDLVIHQMDGFAGAIGVSDSEGKCSPIYSVCLPIIKDANTHYYAYLLRHMARSDFIISLARGIRERSSDFRFDVFKELVLPIPPLAEQQAIATWLNKQTGRIDALIAKKQRLIELLQEKRTALISQAVTKGLDPNAPMKDSGVEWLGEVPEHWQIDLVKRYFQIDLGKMLDGNKQPENEVSKPYLRAANIFWEGVWLEDVNEMKFSRNQMNHYRLKKGDLLVTEGGATVGRSTIWQGEIDDCYYQNSLNRARSYGNTSVKFLFFWLYALKMNGFIDILAEKATFGHLTKEKLEEIQMTIPPALEQLQIINFLDRETAKIGALSAKVNSAIQKLQEYRTALISAAVTGKIDIRDSCR